MYLTQTIPSALQLLFFIHDRYLHLSCETRCRKARKFRLIWVVALWHYPRPSQVDIQLPDALVRTPNTTGGLSPCCSKPTQSLGGMGQAGGAEGLEGTKFSCLGAGSCRCSHCLCSEEPHSQRWFNTLLHSPPWLQMRLTEQNYLYHEIQCVGRGLCAWIPRLNTQKWHTEQGRDREAGDDPQW